MSERIAVIGLGYVGLPVAMAFAAAFSDVVAFDIGARRIAELRAGRDRNGDFSARELCAAAVKFTDEAGDLDGTTFFVIAVPTPIDGDRRPDLSAVVRACAIVGAALKPGGLVVVESTVYPGVTEEICGPALAAASGLRQGADFKLGYSPERINPGDRAHRFESVVKVIAAEDDAALARLEAVYAPVIGVGLHRAPSIKVAEAAKVIENTQRDLNVALMNELALICDRLGLRTADVLAAARTKWNFLPFAPGLVGGHCIGVDPYYLTARAEQAGYYPEVILAGRRINDSMGGHVAQKLVKLLVAADKPVKGARIAILGLSFKENVPDLRNSRVPDIIAELRQFGIEPRVHDPLADAEQARALYRLELTPFERLTDLDGVILAVPHQSYLDMPPARLASLARGGIFIDVKSALDPAAMPAGVIYWSL